MASWDINHNPLWGGVTICLDENETKNVENASDVVSALASLVAAAPNPVQGAAAVIAAYIQLEKGAVESADQGNGVCLFAAWAAIAAGQAELVVPSARPVPPVAPGHHLEVGWLDGAVNASWNWRDDNVDNGQWHQPFSIPTSTPRANSPLVVVSRYPSHLEVFWIDSGGNISSNWIDDNVDNRQWHQPASIASTGSRADSPLVAISRY